MIMMGHQASTFFGYMAKIETYIEREKSSDDDEFIRNVSFN